MKYHILPVLKELLRKEYKGKNPLKRSNFQKLQLFIEEPHHYSLKTHKLIGELKDLWSFSIEYNLRVVFYFSTSTKAVFVDIGTHEEVY